MYGLIRNSEKFFSGFRRNAPKKIRLFREAVIPYFLVR